MLLLASAASAADRFPGAAWEKTAPEAAGWSQAKLADARAISEVMGSTAVMIVHKGVVVDEWGEVAAKTNLHSVRKSLLSALIGIAVEERKIDLSDTMAKLGIDDNAPSLSEVEKQARVGDLLKARSGVYHAALYETSAMAARRPPRGAHAPDTHWYYNNWDFNALGTIYERAEKRSIFEALDERIAKPIGMQDYQPIDGSYVTGPASDHRAYPIRMSARDLARFALLYLREGRWNDRQIVPAQWVRDSAYNYSSVGPGRGYGYMWWIGPAATPPGSFFAAGAGGQYALVIPSRDLVVVHRINSDTGVRDPSSAQLARFLRAILDAAPN
ncbi:MAG: serine hydrolase [Rhodospirillaceae bacterium]|nr:serine hydrolase [Rhodospirillaceae bacterium]